MVKSLDLAIINTLAASGAYGGQRVLSPLSEVTILCAGVWLSNLLNWQGAGFYLTDAEIDEIEELVAELQEEAMTLGGDDLGNYTKIAEQVVTADTAAPFVSSFDEGDYQSFELWLNGLKSDDNVAWVDDVVMTFNLDTTAANYDSFSVFEDVDDYIRYEHIGNYAGIRMYWAASTVAANDDAIGFVKLRLYAPQGDDIKYVEWEGTASDLLAGRLIKTKGMGIWRSENAITSIKIAPRVGTTFVVDPADPNEPSELRMTLYGLT